jgi:hypothetical protein
MSLKQMTIIDFEVRIIHLILHADRQNPTAPEMVIISISGEGRRFTSLDKSSLARRASFTCAATTHEVIWVDELKGGSPVVSWRHDFGGGLRQDLRLNVVQTSTTGESTSVFFLLMAYCRIHSPLVAKLEIGHGVPSLFLAANTFT